MATLDLVFDSKTKKNLYAKAKKAKKAKKDLIDFLVSLLTLPAATVIGLLTKSTNNGMVGCLGSLYASIENMSEIYLQPKYKKDKDSILKRQTSSRCCRTWLNRVGRRCTHVQTMIATLVMIHMLFVLIVICVWIKRLNTLKKMRRKIGVAR
ncbi:hypothetical protein PanWU01x14_068200 [Parasponia andersonii]|uniref:Transmembrane protein n=1 Tax=Parasponia andersonii TaxID=3476 RepID=A0A2P5DFA7_PARAD|nr:hypothetical protein PanWU01x14_068200 [Parasponia andersonii]